jgi:hypothetical protein
LSYSIEILALHLHASEAWFAKKAQEMLVASDLAHQDFIVLDQTSRESPVHQGTTAQRGAIPTLSNAQEELSTCISDKKTVPLALWAGSVPLRV